MAYQRDFKHKKQWQHKPGGFKKPFKKREEYQKPDGLQVFVRDNDIVKALRKMKRMIKNAGLMEELRDRAHYRKPSEIKREKKKVGPINISSELGHYDNLLLA